MADVFPLANETVAQVRGVVALVASPEPVVVGGGAGKSSTAYGPFLSSGELVDSAFHLRLPVRGGRSAVRGHRRELTTSTPSASGHLRAGRLLPAARSTPMPTPGSSTVKRRSPGSAEEAPPSREARGLCGIGSASPRSDHVPRWTYRKWLTQCGAAGDSSSRAWELSPAPTRQSLGDARRGADIGQRSYMNDNNNEVKNKNNENNNKK
jgi:hypothetical protein